jgi:hypothetical protein
MSQKTKGFSDEEKAAMKEQTKELFGKNNENAVLVKITVLVKKAIG